jgi:ferrochelatase
MRSYLTAVPHHHEVIPITGVLLVNLGTPEAPTPAAVRRYLAEFLSDPRVTEMPRWLWWWILHGIILRVRPARVARNYQKIWTNEGSPLLSISFAQVAALQQQIDRHFASPFKVVLAMRYGHPSIAEGLEQLRQANAQKIIILPLYPQYASATTGSVFDGCAAVLKQYRVLPELRFITHYHDQTAYITALATQIKNHWRTHGQSEQLLFSFHGLPKRFFLSGDPYYCECQKTARLVANQLNLAEKSWQVVFQSRFGREEWLQPYMDNTLKSLAQTGIRRVDVICPGFAADCLETLEEINHTYRNLFLQAGGKEFHYIPALNDQPEHIQALLELIIQHTQGWQMPTLTELQQEATLRAQRVADDKQYRDEL